jgi:hypothetical protein
MAKEITRFSVNYEDAIQAQMADRVGAVENMVIRNPSIR